MEKTNRNRLLLWIAIVLLSVNLLMVLVMLTKSHPYTNDRNRSDGFKGKNHQEFETRMARELNLDSSQMEKFHELKKDHWKKMKPLRDSIQQKKWLIHQQLMSKNPDTNYIFLLADTIGELNAEFEKLNYQHLYQIKEELNGNQLDKFKEVLECLPLGIDPHRQRQRPISE